jgi:hypothetical protein
VTYRNLCESFDSRLRLVKPNMEMVRNIAEDGKFISIMTASFFHAVEWHQDFHLQLERTSLTEQMEQDCVGCSGFPFLREFKR